MTRHNAGVGGPVTGTNPRLIDLVALAPSVVSAPVAPEDLTWQDSAVCAQTDPEIFFPEVGDATRLPKGVCRACPVRESCLGHALDRGEAFGVWGGLSPEERTEAVRARAAGVSLGDVIAAADAAWDAMLAAADERRRELGRRNAEAYWAAKAAQSSSAPQSRKAVAA